MLLNSSILTSLKAHSNNTLLTFYINTSRLKNLSSRRPKLNLFDFEEENRLAAKRKERSAVSFPYPARTT